MAAAWPQVMVWPTALREHATHLSKHLRDILLNIERSQDQPVPSDQVKNIIMGTLGLVLKMQNNPDVST
ncbi:hypothetical protein EJ05DRAFT_422850, partial [Pseudovirgaria hyperparasitica]